MGEPKRNWQTVVWAPPHHFARDGGNYGRRVSPRHDRFSATRSLPHKFPLHRLTVAGENRVDGADAARRFDGADPGMGIVCVGHIQVVAIENQIARN